MAEKHPECPLYNPVNCREYYNPKVCAVVRKDKKCLKKRKAKTVKAAAGQDGMSSSRPPMAAMQAKSP